MVTPLAAFSLRLRARIPNHPGVLGHLATAIGAEGGSLVGIDIVETDGATLTRDVVVFCGSEGHAAAVEAAARAVEAGAAGRAPVPAAGCGCGIVVVLS